VLWSNEKKQGLWWKQDLKVLALINKLQLRGCFKN